MCRTGVQQDVCAERRCNRPMCRTNVLSNVAERITICRSIFDSNPTPYTLARLVDFNLPTTVTISWGVGISGSITAVNTPNK